MRKTYVAICKVLLVVILCLTPTVVFGRTIYVDNTYGNPPPGSGTVFDPFHSIQTAIVNAAEGDTIQVASGIYQERIILKDGIGLLGAGAQICVLDGKREGSVITITNARDVQLRAFTVTNGTGTSIPVEDGLPSSYGGGIYIVNSEVQIADLHVRNNTVPPDSETYGDAYGGGLYCDQESHVVVENTVFESNKSVRTFDVVHPQRDGGGIYSAGEMVLENCRFVHNHTGVLGSAVCTTGSIIVSDSVLHHNFDCSLPHDYSQPAALSTGYVPGFGFKAESTTVQDCSFYQNLGAISVHSGRLVLTNTLVTANRSTALYIFNTGLDPMVVCNCTVVENLGWGLFCGGHGLAPGYRLNVANSVFWSNGRHISSTASSTTTNSREIGDFAVQPAYPNIYNCLVKDGYEYGENILTEIPEFENTPLFWDCRRGEASATSVEVLDGTYYTPGDIIEINDDGIFRTVLFVVDNVVSFSPPYYEFCEQMIIADWGPDIGTLDEDFHVLKTSPCIDVGSNSIDEMPDLDLDGHFRILDGNNDGTAQVDIGVYEALPMTVWVDDDAANTAPGTGTLEDPFHLLQDAIDNVKSPGGVIHVADGIYAGPGNRDLDLKGKRITLQSENGPAGCVIDCEGLGRGFSFHSGESSKCIVDGFTVMNGSAEFGAAVYVEGSSPTLRNCIVLSNVANQGGGVYVKNASPQIANCIFARNESSNEGGGIYTLDSSPVLVNCTLTQNSADRGGGIYSYDSGVNITNCIVWDNMASASGSEILSQGSSTIQVRYCNVKGGHDGEGNIDANPLFGDPVEQDFHLRPGSPCIDAGNDSAAGLQETDFEGHHRILDGNDDGVERVDIGADESLPLTVWVDDDFDEATPGWTKDHFDCIQDAIDGVNSFSGTVNIADGIYAGLRNRDLDFRGKAALMQSDNGPSQCVVDCEGAGRGFIFQTGEKSDSVISGLTILGGYASEGGAILCLDASPSFVHCIIRDSCAEQNGGAVRIQYGSPNFLNCVVVRNSAGGHGGAISSENGIGRFTNCIIWDNGPSSIHGGPATTVYCDVEGGYPGEGNIDAGPGFVDALGNDFHLGTDSPCIDAGKNDAVYPPYQDFEGDPRIIDGNADGIAVVDMGVDEVRALEVWVDDDLGNPYPGTGTLEDPFHEIQSGIKAALAPGGVVSVADGLYRGSGNKNLDYEGKGITVRSTNGPLNCVIDCEGDGRGFYFHSREGANSVLDGLTVTKGNAWDGGAVACREASPTFLNCVFLYNTSRDDAGAVYCQDSSNAQIKNCAFIGNWADDTGGAMRIQNASPAITNCTFTGNGCAGDGVGIFNSASFPRIINSIFREDMVSRAADEITDHGSSSSDVTYCIVQGGYQGEGNRDIDPQFTNMPMFWDRTTVIGTSSSIEVADSSVYAVGDVIEIQNDNVVRTVIFASSTTVKFEPGAGDAPEQGSMIENWGPGATDLHHDFHLEITSPAIDVGSSTSADLPSTDFEGDARIHDGNGDGTEEVDIGVDEVPLPAVWVDDDYDVSTPGWGIDHFDHIQDGIDAVFAPAIVYVAAGRYYESIELKPGINVLGAGAEDTIIDGKGSGSVVTAMHVDSLTRMDGFAIVNGAGTLVREGTVDHYYGGGVYILHYSSPTISNCIIRDNQAEWGGGMYIQGYSAPTIRDCTFSSNTAYGGGGIDTSENWASKPLITDCIFEENEADFGGGLSNRDYSDPVVNSCTFVRNTANCGGGMRNYNASPVVTNSIFWSNQAVSPCGKGAGMDNRNSSATITNCTFFGNIAADTAGAMYNWADLGSHSLTVTNCIMWADVPDEISNQAISPQVKYCDIEGDYGDETSHNLNSNPLFVDEQKGDFRLRKSSPCIDVGDNGAAHLPVADFEGQKRRIDGDNVPGAVVDIGADEYMIPFTVWVDDDFTSGGDNSGHSWGYDAYDTIQAGIEAVARNGTVRVADGTYRGQGNINLDFAGKALTLKSDSGLRNCIIDCEGNSRAFQFHSGEDSRSIVNGFTIINGSAYDGGAIHCTNASSPCIVNCRISANEALDDGGAVYCHTSSPSFANCILAFNEAQDGGGAAHLYNSNAVFVNCVIAGNLAQGSGGGLNNTGSSPTLTNCIIWDNSPSPLHGGTPTVTYSVIEGGHQGQGNIDEDPLFVDPNNGDFHIRPYSPCLDSGDNTVVLSIAQDFEGDNRIIDGDGDGSATVDIGVDEVPISAAWVDSNFDETTPGWGIDHFAKIQDAINAVPQFGVVLLAKGIYRGVGNRDLDFHGKAIEVRSERGPLSCVIDCEGNGRGFTFHDAEGSTSVVRGITIINGNAMDGGAIRCTASSSPVFADCIFSQNASSDDGGAVYCHTASPYFINCALVFNQAADGGGAVHLYEAGPTFVNCLVAYNSTDNVGGGFNNVSSSPILTNCIVWGNAPNQLNGSLPAITYSVVTGGFDGEGNTGQDPMFVDSHSGDFHLQPGSPCIDAGNTFVIPQDILRDLDGHRRLVDDPLSIDSGQSPSSIPVVDVGPYEYAKPGNIDSVASVTLSDLCSFAEQWAREACGDCGFADLDNDGSVDFRDLAIISNNWLIGVIP